MLLVGAALHGWLATLEFGRNADGTGTFYALMARNYLRGMGGPLGMPTLSVSAKPGTLYAHHPPLVAWVETASAWTFGDRDWAYRLPPALFTVASGVLLFCLLRPRVGLLGALTAGLVFELMPMAVRFGQMPDVVNSQLVFAALLVMWRYLKWVAVEEAGDQGGVVPLHDPTCRESTCRKTPARRAGLLLGALALAALTDWPAFYLVPLLVLHLMWLKRWRDAGVVAGFGVVLFAALMGWCCWAAGDAGLIARHFLARAAKARADNQTPYTAADWLRIVWRYNRDLHTAALVVLSIAGAGWCWCRQGLRGPGLLALLAFGWALIHATVGQQGNLNHDWWWWPTTLAVAVGVGALVGELPASELGKRRPLAATLAVALVGWTAIACTGEVRHVVSPEWMRGGVRDYSAREFGEIVQEAAPQGRAVMAFWADPQPYTLYYADRPMIFDVWDPEIFERRMRENRGDLFYTFTQVLNSPPAAYVFPKANEPKGRELLAYLRTRYLEKETGEFWVFNLDAQR